MHFVKQIRQLPLNSLSVKVLLAYVVGVVLSTLCIGLVAIALMIAQESDMFSPTNLAEVADGLAGELVFDDQGIPVGMEEEDNDMEDAWFFFDSLNEEAAYRVLDSSGHTVMSSSAGTAFWSSIPAIQELRQEQFEFDRNGVAIQGATKSIENQGRTWFVQIGISNRFLNLINDHIAVPFMVKGVALFGLVLLFIFGICGYVTLKYTFKPLRKVSTSAAKISPHSLHARLAVESVPREVAPLVTSFNHVLDRLEQGYRVQKEFLATAAHELKTPLLLIRAQIELEGTGGNRNALLLDIEHMTRQVQQLLILAETIEAQNYRFTTVDVHDVVKETATYLQRMTDAAGVRLVIIDNACGSKWKADKSALFTLLKNLIENAIQHAPPGTEIRITLNATTVEIKDQGPGVTEEQLPLIFNRFWRGPHRRDYGAGLGLAICKEIAQAHGWTLSAHRMEPGLCFRISHALKRSTEAGPGSDD